MELRQLKYFVAVAETLNFSRAADSLYLSQSALSKQISDLEAELDTKLFVRNNRSVALTESGKTLLTAAKSILAQTDNIYKALHFPQSEQLIQIGMEARTESIELLRQALAETVYQKSLRHPGLLPRFVQRNTADSILSGLQNELDLGIVHLLGTRNEDSLEYRTLLQDEFVLISRRYEWDDTLDNVRMILRSETKLFLLGQGTSGMTQILNILDTLDCYPEVIFVESLDNMLLNVESGNGVTFLPYSIYKQIANQHTRSYHLNMELAKINITAVWKKDAGSLIPEIVENTARWIRENQTRNGRT